MLLAKFERTRRALFFLHRYDCSIYAERQTSDSADQRHFSLRESQSTRESQFSPSREWTIIGMSLLLSLSLDGHDSIH